MYDEQNVFAKILRGEIPCHKLYEDDLCLAFMDIQPVNPGHFLVITKKPAALITELDDESAGHLLKIGRKLSKALRESGLKCEGVNFWISDGGKAGQEIPHVHLHVIPRFTTDGFGMKVGPQNRIPLPHPDLAEAAAKIRARLEAGC